MKTRMLPIIVATLFSAAGCSGGDPEYKTYLQGCSTSGHDPKICECMWGKAKEGLTAKEFPLWRAITMDDVDAQRTMVENFTEDEFDEVAVGAEAFAFACVL